MRKAKEIGGDGGTFAPKARGTSGDRGARSDGRTRSASSGSRPAKGARATSQGGLSRNARGTAKAAPGRPPRARPAKPTGASRLGRASASGEPARSRSSRPPPERPTLSPEELLQRAMAAQTPRARGLWARRGLSAARRLDRTTQSMLLRQLYLAYFETRRFDKALEVSQQNLRLEVLPDVVHQDAARAAYALGDVEGAAGHLRLAARVGPAKRRAFHWWTLGSVYFLAGRHQDAVSALTRAARWGTTDKPLYQGHLAVARCAAGEEVPELTTLLERLAEVPAGQGYGRFVLGHLAYYGRRWDEARRYLTAFVKRSEGGRAAVAIALEGEIALARKTLAGLEHEA